MEVIVTCDGIETRTTFASFVTENDGLDVEEAIAIGLALANGEAYYGGGGASPEWTIQSAIMARIKLSS